MSLIALISNLSSDCNFKISNKIYGNFFSPTYQSYRLGYWQSASIASIQLAISSA